VDIREPGIPVRAGPDDATNKKSDMLMDMLAWATKHADPERAKELQAKMEAENLTIKDIYGQEVFDALFVDEADEMVQAVRTVMDYQNESLSNEDLEETMLNLQDIIHQVDNAGNLHQFGGLEPLLSLGCGHDRTSELRAVALWTFGVAVGNNEPVQQHAKLLGALARLANLLPRCTGPDPTEGRQFCGKLLFAISGVIRNDAELQMEADQLGVFKWLIDVGVHDPSIAIAKKALSMVDICLAQNMDLKILDLLPQRRDAFGAVLLRHVRSEDMDAAEKALRLTDRLLSLRPFLFADSFAATMRSAAKEAVSNCQASLGEQGAEVCDELSGMASAVELKLTARDLSDNEL
jgi:hypothetical protein